MDKINILRIDVDRSGRVTNSQNLSLNQCSDNNRICVYLERDYDYIEMSFRKPDGWLSDRVTLWPQTDDEGNYYVYYDIAEEFTSFVMGGRNGILSANLYFHYYTGEEPNRTKHTATAGNIRINVNYVDDALVHTAYSTTYMDNINANMTALGNEVADLKQGTIQVGSAVMDQHGMVIDTYYETKDDATQKYSRLNEMKVDKSEIQDQTAQLSAIRTNIENVNLSIENITNKNNLQTELIDINTAEIANLKNSTVKETEFDEFKTQRLTSEAALQKQIDDLASSTNVKEIVGERPDLNKLDMSKFEVGDRVQILSDILYSDLSTIVKWNGTNWEYVGKYSSTSYTRSEIDVQHNEIKAIIPNKLDKDGNRVILMNGSTPLGVSNIEFKTVNGETVLGAGNIVFPIDTEFDANSENAIQNKLVSNALANKADSTRVDALITTINEKADRVDLLEKQNKLKAGSNVTITDDGIISVDAAITFQKLNEGDELPRVGLSNTIYLVPNQGQYEEVIWVDGGWENLGFIDVDLNNYYNKTETDLKLASKLDRSELEPINATLTRHEGNFATKVDKDTFNTINNTLNTSINAIWTSVEGKANKTEVDTALSTKAEKSEIPDLSPYQKKLVSGENIKFINEWDILGPGRLDLVNTEIVDLGKFVEKDKLQDTEEYKYLDGEIKKKLDAEDAFSGKYDDLINKPNLADLVSTATLTTTTQTLLNQINTKQDKIDSDKIGRINNETILQNKNFELVVPSDLDDYATQKWVEDKSYLTEHQSLEHLATKEELPDLSPYAKKVDIPVIPENVGTFFNDVNYTTKSEVAETYETKADAALKLKDSKEHTNTSISDVRKDFASADTTTLDNAKAYTDASITTTNAAIGTSKSEAIAAAKEYTDTTITNLIGGAPETLNTLKEVADYIADNRTDIDELLSGVSTNAERIEEVNTNLTNKINEDVAAVNKSLTDYTTTTDATLSSHDERITAAKSTADTNKESIETLSGLLSSHTGDFNKYKTDNDAAVAENLGKINTLTSEFGQYKTNNNNKVTALETLTASHTETLTSHGTDIATVKGYKTSIEKNAADIKTNADNIKTNAEDIDDINDELDSINSEFSKYYTKTDANATFLTSTGTIDKAKGIVDYNNANKQIRFTTTESTTDFEISTVDAGSVLTLLSVMVPNEY